MKDKLLTLITDLVGFRTTAGNSDAFDLCFDYINRQLSFFPFVKKVYVKNGLKSVVWLTRETLNPDIVLSAHIDVVPGADRQFILKKSGGKLMGRGVSDMKFALAAFIVALEDISRKKGKLPSLGLMITSDEEIGGQNGTKYLINEIGYCPKVALVPDGGDNFKIVEKAKGVLHLKLIFEGKAAHSSRPWEGENAIDKLACSINNLRKAFPQPKKEIWKTTLSFGKVNGGRATNQVCDLVELFIDLRYTEDFSRKGLLARITKLCPLAKVEEITHGNSFGVNRHLSSVLKWEKLLQKTGAKRIYIKENGASDGRYFSEKEIPTIVSKPIGGEIHSENEWIDLDSVVKYTQILEEFLCPDQSQ